ncbi:MAG: carbonic anhydrase [Bacteriovorax sp.]|nr:carbonic anhydrase [Bacteriovorax sp.]
MAITTFTAEGKSKAKTWQEALELLVKGNCDFAAGTTTHPERGRETLFAQYLKQFPFAGVLSCADSRVVPELVFDVGIGDLFTCRIAGTVLSDAVIGSLEFAVEVLGVPLIIVMGHENCGAFRACMNPENHPNVRGISWQIMPIIEECRSLPGDHLYNSILMNARKVSQQLRTVGPVLSQKVRSGEIKIVPAYHSLSTGIVSFFDIEV